MKRTSFTFSFRFSGKYKLGKQVVKRLMNRAGTVVKTAASYTQQVLRRTALHKTGTALGLAVALGTVSAKAQCNTFHNADSANPIARFVPAGQYIYGLDFVDIDGDGDLDCYAKIAEPAPFDNAFFHMNPLPKLFRNVGSKKFPVYEPDAASGFETTGDNDYLAYSDIQFADLDGDGDYDCFIAETYRSYFYGGITNIHYYENIGTPEKPQFVANDAKNPLGFFQTFYGVEFTLADIDNDGDLDLNCKSAFGNYSYVYMNVGTKTKSQFILYSQELERDVRTYYDWNHDGLLDYFVDGRRSIDYYRNIGPRENPTYVLDTQTGPSFENYSPYRFADLNDDGAVEVFNYVGGYSTLAPVAVIRATPVKKGNNAYVLLSSTAQSPGYKYRWKFNGATIPGATHPSLPVYKKGSYTLLITDSCGTGQSLPYTITDSPDASKSNRLIANLPVNVSSSVSKAYPNPFSSEVTISIHQPATGTSLVKVVDIAGKTVFKKQTADASVVLGSTLKPGVYFIQVWQNNSVVLSQKLIKE